MRTRRRWSSPCPGGRLGGTPPAWVSASGLRGVERTGGCVEVPEYGTLSGSPGPGTRLACKTTFCGGDQWAATRLVMN